MKNSSKRLIALDAFRGLTIAGMITVNTPGSWSHIYPPLRHAEWHGCTPTDLVFPFFLFIVGVAMYFSFKAYRHKISRPAVLKILRRTALIFIIGLALNAFPFIIDYGKLRIWGVLQRIALAYGAGALLCLWLSPKQLVYALGSILLSYWALLFFSVAENPYELKTNIVRIVDLAILGDLHIYHGFGVGFDPEGLLSAIPAVGTVILGFLTGKLIARANDKKEVVLQLFLYGIPLILSGLFWDAWFPINKALWTSSYVLYTAGLAMVAIAFFVYLIDVRQNIKPVQPLVEFGMNPLFIFVFSGLYVKALYLIPTEIHSNAYSWLYNTVFVPIAGNLNGSLLFAISHILLYWLIVHFMFKKRIFIKI